MRTGYFVGVFEVLEVATLDVLRQAHTLCERLVVGVLSDEDVAALRGNDHIPSVEDRVSLLAEVRTVDRAVIHSHLLDCDRYFYFEPECAGLAGPDAQLLEPRVFSRSAYSPYQPRD